MTYFSQSSPSAPVMSKDEIRETVVEIRSMLLDLAAEPASEEIIYELLDVVETYLEETSV